MSYRSKKKASFSLDQTPIIIRWPLCVIRRYLNDAVVFPPPEPVTDSQGRMNKKHIIISICHKQIIISIC